MLSRYEETARSPTIKHKRRDYLHKLSTYYAREYDLVAVEDVAIDSDRRVIVDPKDGVCLVHVDDTVYRFEMPGREAVSEDVLASDLELAADGSDRTHGTESKDRE